MDELIRRSEAIERAAWGDLFRSVPGSVQKELGLEAVERGDATFLSANRVDHLMLNRAIGIGSGQSYERGEIAEAVAHYRRRGIERFWFHLGSHQRYSGLRELLRLEGVVPYPRSWMKFVRDSRVSIASDGELGVRPARRADAAEVSEILAAGFDLPPNAGPLFAEVAKLPDWHVSLIEKEGRVVAAAGLFVRAKDGYLAFAGTRPEARRRGCQRALMKARIRLAEGLGCRRIFTETGLPVAGQPNPSYRNMLRLGFDELCVRDNFAPRDTKWSNQPSSGAAEKSAGLRPRSKKPVKATAPSGS